MIDRCAQLDIRPPPAGGYRIMLIEDNADHQLLERRALESLGSSTRVVAVGSALEGLQMLGQQEFELVIADYRMPGMDGLEFLRALNERRITVPVVIVTGLGNERVAVAALKQGAHDYVVKESGYLELLPSIAERAIAAFRTQQQLDEARQQLAESEERYRHLVHGLDAIVWEADPTLSHFTFVSHRAEAILGYPVEQWVTEPYFWLSFIHPEDRDHAMQRCQLAIADKRDHEFEFRARASDGRIVWIRDIVRVVCEGAAITGLRGIMMDVTERKRVEQELLHERDLLQALMDNIPDSIYFKDASLRFTRINKAHAQVLNVSDPKEVIGKMVFDYQPPEYARIVYADEQRILETGEPLVDKIAKIKKPDGKFRWISATKVPIMDASNRVAGIAGISRDISARMKAEEALQESEERFRSIVETTKEWIWSIDQDGRITYNNPAVKEMTGYDPDELLGKDSLTFIHEEDRQNVQDILRVLFTEKRGWTGLILRWRHKNGTYRYLESNAVPLLSPDGKLLGYRGADRDITERIKLEEQLRQSQKMEAVGRLAGGVAHDFNNLLTAIIGYSDLLLGDIAPVSPMRRDLEEINKAAHRAASLTRQLLAVSRKQILAPQVLDLNDVVANMHKMLRRLISEDIDLVIVPASSLWCVKADPGQIEQVILNLAVNARDAMPEGGKLTIETANVELDESFDQEYRSPHSGYVILAVSDTGCGMDEHTRSHIFEPFFTTKESGKGTGLGLSTVYGIVKQSGGFIRVLTELGKGTAFNIYLPRTQEVAEALKPGNPRGSAAAGSETILLVEDEEIVRKLAREVLEMHGYTVLEASAGNEALMISERHQDPIHLMVTDVVMPQFSGRELAERLATVRPTLKVLYMSGYTDHAIMYNDVLKRSKAFLQKPFTPEALVRRVREMLQEGPAARTTCSPGSSQTGQI